MTALGEKLKSELSQLPIEDRAELASFLIESLDEGADPDGEDAWDTELARRADEIRTGKVQGIPVEKVLAELRTRFP
jgi:putative addiction module component (TIGR02574 family)